MHNRQTKAANDARALKDVSQNFLNNDRHNRTSHLTIGPQAQGFGRPFNQIPSAEGELVDVKDDFISDDN
jgi:hypothetical protein